MIHSLPIIPVVELLCCGIPHSADAGVAGAGAGAAYRG